MVLLLLFFKGKRLDAILDASSAKQLASAYHSSREAYVSTGHKNEVSTVGKVHVSIAFQKT